MWRLLHVECHQFVRLLFMSQGLSGQVEEFGWRVDAESDHESSEEQFWVVNLFGSNSMKVVD